MKKITLIFTFLLLVFCFASCSFSFNNSDNQEKYGKMTIVIKENGEEITSSTIEFKEGTSLYEIMKTNFSIQDNNGFITSINNKDQNIKNNVYWTYTINEQEAPKGIKDIKPKIGDYIVFDLNSLN